MNKDKIKTTIYLENGLNEKIENIAKIYKYKSKNNFILTAINSHIANTILEKEDSIFVEKLSKAIDNHTDSISKRLSKALFRYSVDLSVLTHLVAMATNTDEKVLAYIREQAVKNTKKLKGKVCIEDIINLYKYKEEKIYEQNQY